jgi:hypothetical protein
MRLNLNPHPLEDPKGCGTLESRADLEVRNRFFFVHRCEAGGCDKLWLALWAESAAERGRRGVAQPG